MIKHTKGKWKVGMGGSIRCDYTDKDGDDIIIGGVKNSSIQIGSSPYTTVGYKESIANAHIMAAAPIMLQALERLQVELIDVDLPVPYCLLQAMYEAKGLNPAEQLWTLFADTPINNEDEIEEDFLEFEKGTCRFDIWHWFEEKFDLSVAEDLMGVENDQ